MGMESDNNKNSEELGSWKHLIYAADVLTEMQSKDRQAILRGISHLLASLEVHFPRNLDPVEDFRAYAVRRFCLALRNSLMDF